MLVKVKWQEYDLPEPKAQDVLANFYIGESQTSQQPKLGQAQEEAP